MRDSSLHSVETAEASGQDKPGTPRVPSAIRRILRVVLLALLSFVLLPLALSFLFLGVAGNTNNATAGVIAVIPASAILGWLVGRYAPLPGTARQRYLPLFLPWLLSAFCAAAAIFLEDYDVGGIYAGVLFFLNLPSLVAWIGVIFGKVETVLFALYAACYLPWLIALYLGARKQQPVPGGRLLPVLCVLTALLSASALGLWVQRESRLLPGVASASEAMDHDVDTRLYQPFAKDNRLILPEGPVSLSISGNYPCLDGAIAVYPMYAAMAQAVYKGLDEETVSQYVSCTNTPSAYRRLVDGHIDVFFGAQPSEAQKAAARQAGLEFELTPIAKEGFVFFVHRDNPVDDLSVEQIRAVYTKQITNWKKLGGDDDSILAFQRNEGSGSQTIMRAKVMEGKPMAKPLEEEQRSGGMGGIIRQVADYRNSRNALGYSFRWYATVLNPNSGIKLLKINGVAPDVQNIGGGSYPFTANVYAVTCRPRSPQTTALINWLTSPEGQAFVEKNGYVPLKTAGE